MRGVSPTGRRTFYAQPNTPCAETAYQPPSEGKGLIKDHPNLCNEQIKTVMELCKSPLSPQPSNLRRSAERKSETTIESDVKYFVYRGGKRCPSPNNKSLLGILRPEAAKPVPTFKLRAPFATD